MYPAEAEFSVSSLSPAALVASPDAAPNACWQLDGTEYVLTGGRKCVIFQLIDDHSRLAIATHVAWGETSAGAIAVVSKGIAAHGVPQRLLSDNGAALNPSRRGVLGQLVAYVTALGVEPITGKPYKPTTQGKNERFHQTLFRWLDKQPLAASLEELQEQVDRFDQIYNTERPHQSLPGRITPAQAWGGDHKSRSTSSGSPERFDTARRCATDPHSRQRDRLCPRNPFPRQPHPLRRRRLTRRDRGLTTGLR
jgi:hypothetical protein